MTLTIKDARKSHPLAPAVLRQLGGGKSAVLSAIEAAEHGADSGFVGFTYHKDTAKFVTKHGKAILEAVAQDARDCGESFESFVRSFRCLRDLPDLNLVAAYSFDDDPYHEAVMDALAWYALEAVGRAIADLR